MTKTVSAEAGRFNEAIQTAALQLADNQGKRTLVSHIQGDVDLYERRAPIRDPSLRNAQ